MDACAIILFPLCPSFHSNWIELNASGRVYVSVIWVHIGFSLTRSPHRGVWYTSTHRNCTMNWNALSSLLPLFEKYVWGKTQDARRESFYEVYTLRRLNRMAWAQRQQHSQNLFTFAPHSDAVICHSALIKVRKINDRARCRPNLHRWNKSDEKVCSEIEKLGIAFVLRVVCRAIKVH